MERGRTIARQLLATIAFAVLPAAATLAQTAAAPTPGVALKGHDTVAYFTENHPVLGTPKNRYDWDGTRYLFSSAKNRDAFAANPDRFAPQFGGLCATGIGMGAKVAADPNVWKIVDGKLYVFSSVQAKQEVEKDPALLTRAHQVWKGAK